MTLELIDSHCHLNYDYSPKSEGDLVREANESGVMTLMTVGTDILSIPAVQRISDTYAHVFHTVGMHPHEAVDFKDGDVATLRTAAAHSKCRAIGEIGLDYFYEHSPPAVQQRVFKLQLDLAAELKLPVVIHSRDAEPDLLAALREHCARLAPESPRGVIHCFTGTREFGEQCLALGFYISFSGILTFKNAEALRECARAFPLERLLVETDSPYLAPIPNRGKKCEPKMVRITAEKLAEVRGISLEEVARATVSNTRAVFKI